MQGKKFLKYRRRFFVKNLLFHQILQRDLSNNCDSALLNRHFIAIRR